MASGGFFQRLRGGLEKTRQSLMGSLEAVFSRKRLDVDTLDELEEALILADLGAPTAGRVVEEVNARVKSRAIEAGDGLREGVMDVLRDIMVGTLPAVEEASRPQPVGADDGWRQWGRQDHHPWQAGAPFPRAGQPLPAGGCGYVPGCGDRAGGDLGRARWR